MLLCTLKRLIALEPIRMSSSKKIHQQSQSTRERILAAAAVRFSMHSYEHVGLRDIAADIGVDVALVHRAFGSKEQLFAATLKQTFHGEALLAAGDRTLSEHLTTELLKEPVGKKADQPDPLQMLVRSISHPQAGAIIRRHMQEDLLGPLSALLNDPADQRAALAAGCMLGIGMMRYVLQSDALKDVRQEVLSPLVARIMDSCLGEMGPVGSVNLARPAGSPDVPGPSPSRGSGRKEPTRCDRSKQPCEARGKSWTRSRTRQ